MSASDTARKSYRPETRLVHAGILRSEFNETSEALYLTQGYVYESAEACEARFSGKIPGYVYSRYSNPTMTMFEQRMAALEGAEAARSTATGMAAVTTALMGLVKAGDHVVAAKALFGSCRWVIEEWLPRFGVASTLVDGKDLAAWKKAVQPNTKAFFMETPTNPTLEVYDIAAVADIAHAAGAKLVVDNVFATPLYQSPLQLGADCVVYSATKHIDGQGRVLGGVILASEKFIMDHVHQIIRQTGPSLSPFNAWVLLKGLETLSVRVERQTDERGGRCGRARRAQEDHAADLSGPRRPSAGRYHQEADEGGLDALLVRDQRRQGGRLPFSQRPAARRHHQQSRRRQKPGHASDHDHAPAADAGAARRTRHRRRAGAFLSRARTPRRSGRGSAGGAR